MAVFHPPMGAHRARQALPVIKAGGCEEAVRESVMLESRAVNLSQRSRFAILASFHALWGLVLWFSISRYGLGVSTDSVHLLFGGMNLWAGKGLISYDGGFLKLWPPLYPVLLAAVHGMFDLPMLPAANVLQGAALIGVSACLTVLFARIFHGNFLLAIAATVLSDVGSVVLISFNTAGSDYLQLFLIMLFVLLTGQYIASGSDRAFLGMAVVALLAMMNRYLGVAVLATGVLAILLAARGTTWQRAGRAVVLMTTALPATMWLAITSQLYARRPAISFGENFGWFSRSILGWFAEPADTKHQGNQAILWLWIVIFGIGFLIFILRLRSKKVADTENRDAWGRSPGEAYLLALLLFGACYALVLFGSASVAYFNKLGGRFLLPFYVPLVISPVVAADLMIGQASSAHSKGMHVAVSAGCYAALGALVLLLLEVTMPLVVQSHVEGAAGGENAFNTKTWRENPAMEYWLSHVPSDPYSLITNQPDGVAFNAQHAALASPRKTSGPYGTEEFPLSSYRDDLFRSGAGTYLIWIEPNPCTYCYSVDELKEIAEVQPLFVDAAGGVYRLLPK